MSDVANGRTHWEGCWKDPAHHECAVAKIEEMRNDLLTEAACFEIIGGSGNEFAMSRCRAIRAKYGKEVSNG